MSGHRWSIASAKAGLSRLVEQSNEAPQVIAKRGRPVAVVLSAAEYERMSKLQHARDKWRSVLALSAEIRADGGATLDIPRRETRRSPFARRRP